VTDLDAGPEALSLTLLDGADVASPKVSSGGLSEIRPYDKSAAAFLY
jgi:hypothetical protein